MSKKLAGLLIAFAMVLCLLPAAAMAAEGDPAWITAALGTGGYVYDSNTHTLTITADATMAAALAIPETLTLDLNGHTLTGAMGAEGAVMVADDTTLTVKSSSGAGKLLGVDNYDTRTGQDGVHAAGNGNVIISSGATVQGGKGDIDSGGNGAHSLYGNITIEPGGAAIGGDAFATGRGAGTGAQSYTGYITVSGTAIGGNAYGKNGWGGRGVFSGGPNVTISEKGKAIGGNGSDGGEGVRSLANITVYGTAIGGDASAHDGGNGVMSDSGVIILYGTATGGNTSCADRVGGTGAFSNNGSITVNEGGKAIGGNAAGANGSGGSGAGTNFDSITVNMGGEIIGGNATDANGTGGLGAFSWNSDIIVNEGGRVQGGTGATQGKGARDKNLSYTGDGIVLDGGEQEAIITVPGDTSITYGDTAIDATVNSGAAISYTVVSGDDVIEVGADGRLITKKIGEATVKLSAEKKDAYCAVRKTVKVTVRKKPLTITVNNRTILEGEAMPAFTATAAGLVNSESIGDIQFNDGGATSSVGGDYTITPSGGTIYQNGVAVADGINNYTVTYVAGTLTIFVPVTGISLTCGTDAYMNTDLELTATVVPENATNQTIIWSVIDDMGSDASIVGNTFRAARPSVSVCIKATIANGRGEGVEYVETFDISVLPKPYNLIISANPVEGGTVTGGGTHSHGKSATLNATPNSGYRFVSWTENGNVVSNSQSYTISSISADHTLVAEFELITPITYTITAGASQEVERGEEASFVSDADFTKFIGVELDGATVPASEYTAVPGSTKITLKGTYTDKLPLGEHSLTILSTDGKASTKFTLKSKTPPSISPTVTDPTAAQTLVVTEGETVTLSITAGGTEPLEYRWQIDRNDGSGYKDIPGADESDYTTSPTELKNNGYMYHCVVTNAAGGATSPVFTLRVMAPAATPKTGDSSLPGLWLGLALISIIGLVVTGRTKKA